jgi:hypothetical protein
MITDPESNKESTQNKTIGFIDVYLPILVTLELETYLMQTDHKSVLRSVRTQLKDDKGQRYAY